MDIVKYLRSNQEGWHNPDIVWVQISAARVKEAADEIERLREENEKLRNGSRIVMEKTSWDAFQNASQEIERLREVLRAILYSQVLHGPTVLHDKIRGIVHAALQQKDSE